MSYQILIFVPAFGNQVTTATMLSTHSLRDALTAKGIASGVASMSFPNIAELRGMYLTIFHDAVKTASHLLMVDADMGFQPQLVLDMLMFNEPLVGACYVKRTPTRSWTPSGLPGNTAEVRAGHMRVEGVGMGCTLIRRDCIETLIKTYPELIDSRIQLHPAWEMFKSGGITRLMRFFDPLDIPERGVLSEDLSFCKRWEMCGGQIWANINHNISHVGMYDYNGRYMDDVEADARKQQEAIMAALQEQQEQLKQSSIDIQNKIAA
jgi:hypothetical protein